MKTVPQAEPTPHPPFGHLPLEGKAKSARRNRAARLANKHFFAPNTETFSAVYNISVGCRSRLARSPGGLGGRSRIEFIVSPLPRRRHNESHFAAQSPERAFLAKPFFARAKNGVNSGRRSRKISVSEAKCNICRHKRAAALHLISQLTLTAVSLRLGQARFSVSPGDRFIAAPLLRSPRGEAKESSRQNV